MFAAMAVTLAGIAAEVAGMDGNRTHPGRLSSAPRTVLKTAGLSSTDVQRRPPQFGRASSDSMIIRTCPLLSVKLAVFLAVVALTGDS
jgi:hypothetical protein